MYYKLFLRKIMLHYTSCKLPVVVVGLDSNPTRTTESHLKRRIISTNCCIHTVYLLTKGLDTPETCID